MGKCVAFLCKKKAFSLRNRNRRKKYSNFLTKTITNKEKRYTQKEKTKMQKKKILIKKGLKKSEIAKSVQEKHTHT